jgi:ABC-type Fe3+/spermidine/putrescine transport system ATPase subunit
MLEVRHLELAFDGLQVLRGIDLQVAKGEIVCLLGRSGSGKTSLLRAIAGLELIDSGEVLVDGQSMLQVPVHARGFGFMFQDFALFPHMDVAHNIMFGLKMHGLSQDAQLQRLDEVLELVGLAGFERRDVTQLSGGERQRVALARSLAPNPRLLMLDEPLGSLDATLRERLEVEIRAIIKQVGLTAIYVTHDQQEAFAVADRIAVMNAGVMEQIDTSENLYKHPRTTFVAGFLGLNNIVNIKGSDGDYVHTPIGHYKLSDRPDAILLHPDGIEFVISDAPGAISGRVSERVFQGGSYRMSIEHESGIKLAFKFEAKGKSAPEIGEIIWVKVAPESILPLVATKSR